MSDQRLPSVLAKQAAGGLRCRHSISSSAAAPSSTAPERHRATPTWGCATGLVAAVGDLSDARAERRIEATGKLVTPGFIDQHTHYDAQVFWDPYCSNSGEHGTTTTVTTNCGFGLAPCRPGDRERIMAMLENTEEIQADHMRAALPWDWETWGDLRRTMEQIPKGLNMTSYVPMNPADALRHGPRRAEDASPDGRGDRGDATHRRRGDGPGRCRRVRVVDG